MSHLVEVTVAMDNLEDVKAAAEDLGYELVIAEEGETIHIDSRWSWNMEAVAQFKKDGKGLSLGILQDEEGNLELKGDFYDIRGVSRREFTKKLTQHNAKHKTIRELGLKGKGFKLEEEEVDESGNLVVEFGKRVW